jgi:hypothetical protein
MRIRPHQSGELRPETNPQTRKHQPPFDELDEEFENIEAGAETAEAQRLFRRHGDADLANKEARENNLW